MLSQDMALLRQATSRPNFWPKLILLLLVLTPIYATLTSIVYWTPFFGINPSAEAAMTLPILTIVGLTSILLTIGWSERSETQKKANEIRGQNSSPVGLLGSVFAFFATGCPICQPIWLVWLGLGQASLFLIDLSIWISGLSILLLIYAMHQKLNESCKIR